MLMPSIFRDGFRDSFFDDFFRMPERFYPSMKSYQQSSLMQTDIKENETSFEVTMNLPGFAKEDVKGELKDGYLTISAESSQNKDEKDDDGTYIKRERYFGSCRRSFYVGEAVNEEDIKAKFENGTLKLTIPKKNAQAAAEKSKFISIEG